MWVRPYIDPPLGEVPLPEIKKAKIQVPCGEWMAWDEASWHVLECEPCDEALKARHFIAANDFEALRAMGLDNEIVS